MRRLPCLLGLLLLAAPARADLAADYAAAVRAFTLPGAPVGSMDPALAETAWTALLPTLEGTWAPNLEILAQGPVLPDAGLLARHCEMQGARLKATGPRGFELRRPFGPADARDSYAERFDFLLGNTFQRSFDEAGYLRRLFPDGGEDARFASARASALMTAPRGEAMLFHPAPDLLVIVQPGRPAEFWRRCP